MGWGSPNYDYESTTRSFDTSTTRYEVTGYTTEYIATTSGPPNLEQSTRTQQSSPKITESVKTTKEPSLVPSENGVPIMPVQPGILWPSSTDSPFLMPLWLPLWVVILVGIGSILVTSICCCACFRFRMWQMRVQHYNEVKKLQKRVKKAEKDKENDKENEKNKERPIDSSTMPGSPPQYSERMSDISSIRTATTIRTDRETLKSAKRSRKPDLKDISEEVMEEAEPLKSKDVSPRASSTNMTVKEEATKNVAQPQEENYLEIETTKETSKSGLVPEKPLNLEKSTSTEKETQLPKNIHAKKYKAAPPPRPNEPPPVPAAQRRSFITTKTTATQIEEEPLLWRLLISLRRKWNRLTST
ncbi:Oidioi.mRNA.OKI2018_I69.XSR.g15924.t1.cds [Oikopleura dioica]|uniref:Oidioi.mRNA.OKI2018_I69.XSR.g15924.t1.cds n=1 Tax=Oikopleura dioica TaxID=34765 RepID=A0ABN7SEC3_OIKDI|nr:Oidioi.mRNA.OKI2018_I69.XSR.g15924.t1.cds [Oikopleura dioica]